MSEQPAGDEARDSFSEPGEGAESAPAEIGARITTACNGRIRYTAGTPWVIYQGQKVFFCLPVCKEDFEADPGCSCLAFKLCHMG